MLYLINKKMDPSLSFKTMESVRKGKGLTDEMKKAMIEAGVPEWYIESCLKIQYMFPKAHAAAYVMMAWRVAWYKVYRPLEYYMGYFSIRADAIDYAKMCMGLDRLNEELELLLAKKKEVGKKELSATEKNSIKDMKLVKEMYARGIEFTPIDLMKVDGRYFSKVDDSHIMPSLQSLGGMGGHEVDDLMAGLARTKDDGPFLSLEDFMVRTGCSKSKAALLKELNILSGIPDTNQLSLFDM